MKKRYKSTEEINAAQIAMNTKCRQIEDNFIEIANNPIKLFTGTTADANAKQSATSQSDDTSESNGIMDMAMSLVQELPVLSIAKNVLSAAMPGKKTQQKVLRSVWSITWKVLAVNASIWGIQQVQQRIKKKKQGRKEALK